MTNTAEGRAAERSPAYRTTADRSFASRLSVRFAVILALALLPIGIIAFLQTDALENEVRHQNVLVSLRDFGYYIVAGIHDDHSYFQLKNKYTIENLETRMKNVKPYVDQLYVIPSTDPLLYIQSVVSEKDIETGACCYARGDDMLDFPSRDWVESVMPVHFVPRTEACSSTLIRTIYHSADKELGAKAAFAKTRYDGKPIDDDGNVLP